MNDNEPIFKEITLLLQTCVKNYDNKLHENPTASGVTNTRPQTERKGDVDSTKNIPFYTVKNA
jgi:hypothetical protein